MTSDHHFESTYVGHFVSDGTSFGLRRASSIRRRDMTMHALHRSPKVSSELPRVLSARERSPSMESTLLVPVTSTSTPHDAHQTATRARSQSVATLPLVSSPTVPERKSSAPPARMPIWARGTVSHPIQQSSLSQTTPTVRRVQSQSSLSSNTRPNHQLRSPSMEQNALTTIHENMHVTKTAPSSPSRNPIRREVSIPQRSNSMPAAQLASKTSSQRPPPALSSRETSRATRTTHQTIPTTWRSSSPLTRGATVSAANRRAVVPANTPPSTNPISSRTPSPRVTRTTPSTPSTPLSPARSVVSQQTGSTRVRPVHDLRSVASQPLIRSTKSVARKPTHGKAKSLQHTEGKGSGETEGECCICMNAQSDSVLYRCGHICACMSCAKEMKQCPICREQVTDVIKIWKI
jgi:hypothetical protein